MKVRRKTNRNIRLSAKKNVVCSVAAAAVLLGVATTVNAAQMMNSIGRGPSINVGPRIAPRVDIRPNIRFSPYVTYQDPTGRADQPNRVVRKRPPSDDSDVPRKTKKRDTATVADNSYVSKEVLIEIDGNPGEDQVSALARRFRLTRTESQNLPTLNSTFYRWRIADDRSVDDVVRELTASGDVKSAQRNLIFRLQETQPDGQKAFTQKALQQYALANLRLPEAHALSRGADVRVAVIDSGIDINHPELAGAIESSFDALGGVEGPHAHGTGVAGIIAAHQRLTGTAPSARIIAIRAFGTQKSGAESNTFVVLKSLDYAIAHGTQIINMSFAGPRDASIERGLGVAASKGITLVAAAGNAGPKSPPLYPGADRNVIAVTATDQSDRLFAQANRGGYVAIAAPGVDVMTPLPDGKYGVSSGTSLSAAYISGIAALMISRKSDLTPGDLRAALTNSARDLGPAGRDDQFGAGEADAFAAVSAIGAPIETASGRPGTP